MLVRFAPDDYPRGMRLRVDHAGTKQLHDTVAFLEQAEDYTRAINRLKLRLLEQLRRPFQEQIAAQAVD